MPISVHDPNVKDSNAMDLRDRETGGSMLAGVIVVVDVFLE